MAVDASGGDPAVVALAQFIGQVNVPAVPGVEGEYAAFSAVDSQTYGFKASGSDGYYSVKSANGDKNTYPNNSVAEIAGGLSELNAVWPSLADSTPSGHLLSLEFTENGAIENLDLSLCTFLTTLIIPAANIESIDLSQHTALVHLDLRENSLSTIDLAGMCSHLNYVALQDNSMNGDEYSAVLLTLANDDSPFIENGWVKITNGSAYLNEDGATAALVLANNGWTVLYDSE